MTEIPEGSYRTERDFAGELRVPATMLYGAQTHRAVETFPISNLRFPRRFIRILGTMKREAAEVNHELGLLDANLKDAITSAAREVANGDLDQHFVVDVFQTGSGTNTNMNANEVIANRANQVLGGALGSKSPVHPNDHVNRGQSSRPPSTSPP
jgi:fumarate hydratase, class II